MSRGRWGKGGRRKTASSRSSKASFLFLCLSSILVLFGSHLWCHVVSLLRSKTAPCCLLAMGFCTLEHPKRPKATHRPPRCLQDRPNIVQDRPKITQETKTTARAFKTATNCPTTAPGWPPAETDMYDLLEVSLQKCRNRICSHTQRRHRRRPRNWQQNGIHICIEK